jgi:hypothetical protein
MSDRPSFRLSSARLAYTRRQYQQFQKSSNTKEEKEEEKNGRHESLFILGDASDVMRLDAFSFLFLILKDTRVRHTVQ